jgi:hypothetical protein
MELANNISDYPGDYLTASKDTAGTKDDSMILFPNSLTEHKVEVKGVAFQAGFESPHNH